MKIFMLWKYYPNYLCYFNNKNPKVDQLSFKEHRQLLLEDYFSWPGGLSLHMNSLGINSEFIIVNSEKLQKKWAHENKFKNFSEKFWEKEIVIEQIKRFKPDVLFISSLFDYYGSFLRDVSSYIGKAVTWVGSPFTENVDVSGFSALLTENPNTFKSLQNKFDQVVVTKPGFDRKILDKIGCIEKKNDITFVGSLSLAHSKRIEILSFLIKNGIDLKIFGFVQNPFKQSFKGLAFNTMNYFLGKKDYKNPFYDLRRNCLNRRFRKKIESMESNLYTEVFGLDMYRALASSLITLNVHIDYVNNHSGNMRMFEATGVGSCLLTERFENVHNLFDIEEEIITYKSKEELLDLIKILINNKSKIEKSSQNAQNRTLRDHTIEKMFKDIAIVF